MHSHFGNQYGGFSENWESTYLSPDPSILLLGIYPKDAQSNIKDICPVIFITALFVITRICKQPRCSSTEEWIKKMWYIYTMEYYSVVKTTTTTMTS